MQQVSDHVEEQVVRSDGVVRTFTVPVSGCDSDAASRAMARYAAGDERAFAELHRLLRPRIHKLCARLLGVVEAEDACQELHSSLD